MGKDKRDECGCHRDCTTLPHTCAHPCRWPDCLTEAESRQLADECLAELAGEQADALRHSHDPVPASRAETIADIADRTFPFAPTEPEPDPTARAWWGDEG